MEHKKNSWINAAFFCCDLVASLAAAMLSIYVRRALPLGGEAWLPVAQYKTFFVILIPLLSLVHLFSGEYRRNRGISLFSELFLIIRSVFFTMMTMLALSFFYRTYLFSRLQVVYFYILAVGLTFTGRVLLRLSLRQARRKGMNLMHVLLLGRQAQITEFRQTLDEVPGFGYSIAGSFAFDKRGKQGFSPTALHRFLTAHYVDEAYILLSSAGGGGASLQKAIDICESEGVKVKLVPDVFSFITAGGRMGMLGNVPVIAISDNPLDLQYNRVFKRVFDVVFSLCAIVILLPFMLLIALLIKLTSRGPVLFVQERVGANRKRFPMLKFRTMRRQAGQQSDIQWTKKDDPRRTRLGEFLRRTSLDETPQFFNVLVGQMSVVGPRPERPYFVDKFKKDIPEYMRRHHVKSGITGWAQVNGLRGDTSIRRRVQADLYYIRNWSPGLDMRIILLTILRGFAGKNAY